ncbi:MAG: hypothetical protein RLZZ470_1760 [Pseudomonadota bacterium]|jgi:uncharacterized protein YndB with AHSA1/START domain
MNPLTDHSLTLTRVLMAPRSKIWRCWCEPELLMQWYCPQPWFVTEAQMDVRVGGAQTMVMNGPNGEKVPVGGVYLQVIDGERLVFTDAFVSAWQPSAKPFMVGDIAFSDTPEGHTLYVARALHWNEEDKTTHENMGFHQGWGAAADQLEALAQSL